MGGDNERESPSLYCQISNKAAHRFTDRDDLVQIVPDSGCTVSCVPEEIALRHGLKISPVDEDEPAISTYGGVDLHIVGQCKAFLKCVVTGSLKMLHGIVIRGASEQSILLSWQEMLAWGILSPHYPYPFSHTSNTSFRTFNTDELPETEEPEGSAVDIGLLEANHPPGLHPHDQHPHGAHGPNA